MSFPSLLPTVDALAARIPDGAKVAVPVDHCGVAMELTRAMLRRGVRNLHLVCAPMSGIQADMLLGAGAVETIETSAVSLGEYGPPGRFVDAVRGGRVVLKDATCPAIYAALQAGQKNIPFMPLRGILGSDVAAHRPDWKVVDNPFAADGEKDPILLLPAIRPDYALFHARYADRNGAVFIGRHVDLRTMAQASINGALVTVEEVRDVDMMTDPATAAAALPPLYVEAVAVAERGAWPLGMDGAYGPDDAGLRRYADLSRSEAGFQRYLDETVRLPRAAE